MGHEYLYSPIFAIACLYLVCVGFAVWSNNKNQKNHACPHFMKVFSSIGMWLSIFLCPILGIIPYEVMAFYVS